MSKIERIDLRQWDTGNTPNVELLFNKVDELIKFQHEMVELQSYSMMLNIRDHERKIGELEAQIESLEKVCTCSKLSDTAFNVDGGCSIHGKYYKKQPLYKSMIEKFEREPHAEFGEVENAQQRTTLSLDENDFREKQESHICGKDYGFGSCSVCKPNDDLLNKSEEDVKQEKWQPKVGIYEDSLCDCRCHDTIHLHDCCESCKKQEKNQPREVLIERTFSDNWKVSVIYHRDQEEEAKAMRDRIKSLLEAR